MKSNSARPRRLEAVYPAVLLILPASVSTLAGCSSSSSAPASTPSTADASGGSEAGPSPGGPDATADAGAADAPAGYALSWQVVEAHLPGVETAGADAGPADAGDAGATPPIPGARVCVDQHPEIPCATSAADGTFVLSGLPGGTDLALTLDKSGYTPTLQPIQTSNADMVATSPLGMTPTTDPLPDAGFAIDLQGNGAVTFFALAFSGATATPAVGVTAALSPAAGHGPLYTDGRGKIDLAATSLSGYGGLYYDVPAGDYTLTFAAAAFNCSPISTPFAGWGYPLPPASVKFPVKAGYTVGGVGVLCAPSAPADAGLPKDAGAHD